MPFIAWTNLDRRRQINRWPPQTHMFQVTAMPKNLLAGESMVMQPLRQHWIVLVERLWFPVVVGLALLVVIDGFGGTQNLIQPEIRLLVTLLVMAVVGLWVTVVYLMWSSRSLTVTDQRVILEWGILTRSSKQIALDRVQDVTTHIPPLGRILNYGLVEIDVANVAGAEKFEYARAPEMLRDQVFVLSEQLRRGL
jgi:membrane protein YdbS with pleckstrin-like domain